MQQHPDIAAPYSDGETGQQILRVLAQHPAGLAPGEIASQLGLTTSLTRQLRTMAQAGLVRRVAPEVYVVRKE